MYGHMNHFKFSSTASGLAVHTSGTTTGNCVDVMVALLSIGENGTSAPRERLLERSLEEPSGKVTLEFERGYVSENAILFMVFFQNLSDKFKALISGFSNKVLRSFICSNDEDHSRMDYEAFPTMLDVENDMRNSFSAEKSFVGEKELDEEFNAIFLHRTVIREKKFRCRSPGCGGVITSRNVIDSLDAPPFIFLSDPTGFMQVQRTESNIYLPETISICTNATYTLHGRVYSTSSDGSHFFTVFYKIIDNKTFLVRIDNINNSIRIITSDMEKARKILRKYPKTVNFLELELEVEYQF
ncbi:hypothetical protein EDC94DRAFT_579786 [Helicostylum pulchrum]|nr:hypothetical protein EDC94DRAFT_579786 [Helicostylum pulchrum]